jgi:hypothetical protein
MDLGTICRFAYHVPWRVGRRTYSHLMRDCDAALYLIAELCGRGYRIGPTFFNFPRSGLPLIPAGEHLLGAGDLLVATTRLPMDDLDVGGRRIVHRSYTTLEDKVLAAMRRWFRTCARSEVVLTDAAAAVSPEIARRQTTLFRLNCDATYRTYGSAVRDEWTDFQGGEGLTAAFLVHTEIWPGGPKLLATFGMGGIEGLVWCYKLATEYPHLLATTPFVMAELRAGERPTTSHTMEFADSWEIEILGIAPPDEHPNPDDSGLQAHGV